jgi:hypothetical protein
MGEMDLDDVVLSWSVPEITDDDLYRDKVRVRHRTNPTLFRCSLTAASSVPGEVRAAAPSRA